LHILLPKDKFTAKNVVSREVLDMSFRDMSGQPRSARPVGSFDYSEYHGPGEDVIDDMYADMADEHEPPTVGSADHAHHFEQNDGDFIGRGSSDDEDEDDDEAILMNMEVPSCKIGLPYSVQGYNINYAKEYPISDSGDLVLLPNTTLIIEDTSPNNLNCSIASFRSHAIAFQPQGTEHGPLRWSSQTADIIRPRLAEGYLKLARDIRLKLAMEYNPLNPAAPTDPATMSIECEEAMMTKFAHDIGTEGVLMPIAAMWLISQMCVVQNGPLKLWRPFSICVFQVDSATINAEKVRVRSSNALEWTAFVHFEDNQQLSAVVLPLVIHNKHYSSAQFHPKQDTGK
jgi:hypothetical protein